MEPPIDSYSKKTLIKHPKTLPIGPLHCSPAPRSV